VIVFPPVAEPVAEQVVEARACVVAVAVACCVLLLLLLHMWLTGLKDIVHPIWVYPVNTL